MADGLFTQAPDPESQPLATRMRPESLDEYVGQSHLLAPGSATRKAIEEARLGSVVLWSPPGTGKTTLARLIAACADAHVEALSAVTAGVRDVRRVAEEADRRRGETGRGTLMLLDEIHHFNKSQQDALLGDLETGTYQLVGCTTENPFFALNDALLSRARVLPLKPLDADDLRALILRALSDESRGIGGQGLEIDTDALDHLIRTAAGDARLALGGLEAASMLLEEGGTIRLGHVEDALQKGSLRYDRAGDSHYDTISAFIKSVRGSDSDAAMHYLARMLEAGEDPRFIARRLIILASEDIGNAEPLGLLVANAAMDAVANIGMPEARIVLGQVTTFLSEAPKSNRAYIAIDRAIADVRKVEGLPIPLHLRNAARSGMGELGYGEGYLYPHDYPDGFVDQKYLPEGDLNVPYYEPSDRGHEKRMQDRRRSRPKPPGDDSDRGP